MRSVKAALIAFVMIALLAVGGAIVKAASSGEDFKWLATTDNGVRIGDSGLVATPGEGVVEFAGEAGVIDFAGQGSIEFSGSGFVESNTELVISAFNPVNFVMGLLVASAGSAEGAGGIAIMGFNTPAGLAAADGSWEGQEVELDLKSTVVCTTDGDVVVTLGSTSASN